MPDLALPADRRHDLDALRSFAMLLGVALHAALAYIGPGWVVSDDRSSPALALLVPAIHGVRMPLFFLLSGFFTAMLWRRHGLSYLLAHRARRILLPLVVACLTILPAMWAASAWAISQQSAHVRSAASDLAPRPRAPSPDIWTVAAYADMDGLRAYSRTSPSLNAPDPTLGVTPLGWTAIADTPEATRYLLEIGADPSAPYRDGNTPLHTACFFGRAEVAELLIRAGADLAARSAAGELPAQSMRHDRRTVEFIANMLKIPVDFEAVAQGRARIERLIEGDGPDPASAPPPTGAEGSSWLRSRLLGGMFFQHLWFLWFLCWLNAGFALLVLLARTLPGARLPALSPPLHLLWLVPLTMLTQSRMHAGGAVPGFGPDTSAGLLPAPHVLLYYATFFAAGALMNTLSASPARLGRRWYLTLPAALVILPAGLMFGYHDPRAAAIVADDGARRWAACLLQVLYAWLMTFGLIGLFGAILPRPRPWVRYLSDASYWIYLAHLPLIIAGQALLLRTDLPPIAECALLTAATTAALLVAYHVAVRFTPVGTTLHGPRARRR